MYVSKYNLSVQFSDCVWNYLVLLTDNRIEIDPVFGMRESARIYKVGVLSVLLDW